ncbi:class I SAM-dependent methyltransferase [Orrella sp. JC864]|uniref:SAM-dependent methyltransferase n=1 Tax=Orrella sp. JC864 TaxID=3120298 RepID=UPI0012BB97BD
MIESLRVSFSGRRQALLRAGALALALAFPLAGQAQQAGAASAEPAAEYVPNVGQSGKDVVWVPTPQSVVEKMLDLAQVTPQDRLMDLGSGDGRTVITAAQRGLTAKGIEYNPDMVELARRNAAKAGVSERATFETADLFETDLSQADVITMFLLPSINEKLRPTILDLEPGTRIVSNTFRMGDWEPDASETVTQDCSSYCTALLWVVPAKVQGQWQLGGQPLALTQQYQMISGKLGDAQITEGRVDGTRISFVVNGVRYSGQVQGDSINGTEGGSGSWTASRRG